MPHDPRHEVRDEYTPDQCRVCWVEAHDPRYRAHTGGDVGLPCSHRGPQVGTVIPAKAGCQCKGSPPIFRCGALGEQYAIQSAPGWFGTPLAVVNLPANVIDWREAPGTAKVRIRCCGGCELRDTAPTTTKFTNWSVAVTTAPRRVPTLENTLRSLEAAGWSRDDVTIFAEPDSPVPDGWRVERAAEMLGAWKNSLRAVETALRTRPDADAVLLLQDDVELSAGLKTLLESLAIPADAGLVSPYCPTVYAPDNGAAGLFPVQPGKFKGLPWFGLVGALTVAMPRAAAEQLVADEWVRSYEWDRWVDGVFGHWCHRARRRPYFHFPSLAKHTGTTSTLHGSATATGHRQANTFSDAIDAEQFMPRTIRRELKIGVVGWATASGLGRLNWEACSNLPVLRWLAPRHQRFPYVAKHPDADMWYCQTTDNMAKLDAFLAGLDVVLCFELPYYHDLAARARRLNVKSVCVAMHECAPSGCRGWPQEFDLVIAPNDECFRQLSPAMPRGNLRRQNWPIDVAAIPFRARTLADVFYFGQGTGGGQDRKGGKIVQAAAELTPDVPWVVRSQILDTRMRISEVRYAYPPNVRHLGPVDDPSRLYDDGDVAVQPSRYEGMGLQLLEAQAAGMPLVTTDAAPMNEYGPFRVVPATPRRITVLRPTTAWDVDPVALAGLVRDLHGRDIEAASYAARRHVEDRWSWESQRDAILELLADIVFGKRATSATMATTGGPPGDA